MNLSKALANAKREIGLGPFLKTKTPDHVLVKTIIQEATIPVFSKYFKNSIMLYNVSLTRVNDSGMFKLNLDKTLLDSMKHFGVKIKGICSLKPNKQKLPTGFMATGIGPMYSPVNQIGNVNSNFTLEATARAFTHESVMESVDLGYNHKFVEPNFIQFYEQDLDYDLTKYDITLFTSHSMNLSTIGDNISDSFMKLLKLDMKRILYDNEFKYLNSVETPYTKVDLKIDDWPQASAERQALLDLWASTPFSNNTMVVGI